LKGPKNKKYFASIFEKIWAPFRAVDKKVDGAIGFFLRHYGKSRFMLAMSKKAQILGIERLYKKGPKAFFYFFMFYLIRDTVLYILIPIGLAFWSSENK
jgi:hypothetical protein